MEESSKDIKKPKVYEKEETSSTIFEKINSKKTDSEENQEDEKLCEKKKHSRKSDKKKKGPKYLSVKRMKNALQRGKK